MMQFLKRSPILLLFILLLAGFLRFYQLGTNSPSLSWDEVAFGYNAYTIGIDGRDEFGRFLPLDYLESFGDFKPPMYAYLDVLPVKVFGLNNFAVRFPSALFGTLTVLLTYFLVKRLFRDVTKSGDDKREKCIALLASFILAISPWHIMLSRAAFEANVATFFLVMGVWLFLVSIQEKKWYLPFSAASFIFGVYTFNTARIVGPLLLISFSLLSIKYLWQQKKVVIVSILLGIVLLLPVARFLRTPQASLRFQEVNIFSDLSLITTSNQEIVNDHNAWWSKIIHNRRWVYTQAYVKHYFDNLTPDFLFIHGDGNPKFSIQDVGQMYLWDIPFFVLGILFLIRNKKGRWWIVPLWLIIGIIPAATARETPHALRTEATLPTFQILIAYGIYITWDFLQKKQIKKMVKASIAGAIGLLLFVNVGYFWHTMLTHYQYTYSGVWLYGQEQMADYVQSVQSNYSKIYISEDFGRPYIYMAMYTKTDPTVFRKTAIVQRDVFGFVDILGFGRYTFFHEIPTIGKHELVVVSYQRIPKGVHILHVEHALNGDPVVAAYTL